MYNKKITIKDLLASNNDRTGISIEIINALDQQELYDKISNMSYDIFLNTNYWKFISFYIKSKNKFKCQNCNNHNNLECHHKTYKSHGKEHNNLQDLECLCEICHNIKHKITNNKYEKEYSNTILSDKFKIKSIKNIVSDIKSDEMNISKDYNQNRVHKDLSKIINHIIILTNNNVNKEILLRTDIDKIKQLYNNLILKENKLNQILKRKKRIILDFLKN